MSDKKALIIFVKNPVKGKVKTRLAATIGEDKALAVYKILLRHTQMVSQQVQAEKVVYYADYVAEDDGWGNSFAKATRLGDDLGARMCHAFQAVLQQGYTKAVIIGTDCPVLEADLVEQAFSALDQNDVVLGPALDGGYYLLGMKQVHEGLFAHMPWSTAEVLAETITRCQENRLTYRLLLRLPDVDEEKDLVHLKAYPEYE